MMLRTRTLHAVRTLCPTPVLTRFYHAKVIDHYERPRNVGSLPKTDVDVGTGLYPSPSPLPRLPLFLSALLYSCFISFCCLVDAVLGQCRCTGLRRRDEAPNPCRRKWPNLRCQIQNLWMWKCHSFVFIYDRAGQGLDT